MKNIYLVDYIGIHCGMHYYLEAFKKVLSTIEGFDVKILSNYSDDKMEDAFFLNHYSGSKIKKVYSLLRNIWRLRRFVENYKDSVFIYLSYGNIIDIPFIKIITKSPKHLIDIHEAIAQNIDSNQRLKSQFRHLYTNNVKGVITHSMRTLNFLKEYGFKEFRLDVPHFKYVFQKEYDKNSISAEVISAPSDSKLNFLFFGNISESKGIDILFESINQLSPNDADKARFIIAGKDFDGTIDRVPLKNDRNVTIIRRHITDEELRYLYQNTDYLMLPYRKTSQSGILEMAFYFKKPIIATDVPYFRQTLLEFSSFGMLGGNTASSYAKALTEAINRHSVSNFYNDDDYARYENRDEVKQFVKEFHKWIIN